MAAWEAAYVSMHSTGIASALEQESESPSQPVRVWLLVLGDGVVVILAAVFVLCLKIDS